jgi:hypothetical protein
MRIVDCGMTGSSSDQPPTKGKSEDTRAPQVACPACGGHLIEIRGKLQCERCHTIYETCCEGGPQ